MDKPYIICYMMMSVDGRIDCGVMEKLDISATLSGRITAELEMADKENFTPKNKEIFGKESFSQKADKKGYNIIMDTRGTLLWDNYSEKEKPLLIVTSEKVTKEYIDYLNSKNISWIACGKEKINIKKVVEILKENFKIKRLAVVGGGTINGGFLNEGLIDEIDILIGPGIDGRKGMTAVFDGMPMDKEPVQLKLKNVKAFDNGAVLIQYEVLN